MQAYRVTLTSDLLTDAFVADVYASSSRLACLRVRSAAMHRYQCAELLDAHVSAVPITEAEFSK